MGLQLIEDAGFQPAGKRIPVQPDAPIVSEAADIGWEDIAWNAIRRNSVVGSGIDYYSNIFENRPDLDFTEDNKKEIWATQQDTRTIDPKYMKYVFDARNAGEFQSRINEMEQETRYEKEGGILWDMAATAFDLPLIGGAAKLMEKSFPVFSVARNQSPLARAKFGATAETGYTAIQDYAGIEDKEFLDYATNAGAMALMSSMIKGQTLLAHTATRAIDREVGLKELGDKLKDVTDEATRASITKQHLNEKQLSSNNYKTIDGAITELDNKITSGKLENSVYNNLRFDLAKVTRGSKANTMQSISNQGFIDRTLQNNNVNQRSADEVGVQTEQSLLAHHETLHKPNIQKFGELLYKDTGKTGWWDRSRFGSVKTKYMDLIGKTQMRRTLGKISDQEAEDELFAGFMTHFGGRETVIDEARALAKSTVDSMSKFSESTHDVLSSKGKLGFVDKTIPKSKQYMPIMYDANMAQNLADKNIKYNDFEEFIYDSMVSQAGKTGIEIKDMSLEDLATLKGVAKATSRAIWKNKEHYLAPNSSFEGVMRKAMKQEGLSDEVIENMLGKTKDITKKGSPYTEKRTPLDYTFEKELDIDGKKVVLSFEDLVQTNADVVTNKYARKMGGAVTREKINVSVGGKRAEFDEVFTEVRQLAKQPIKQLASINNQLDKLHKAKDSDAKAKRIEELEREKEALNANIEEKARRLAATFTDDVEPEDISSAYSILTGHVNKYKEVAAQVHKDMRRKKETKKALGEEEYNKRFEQYYNEATDTRKNDDLRLFHKEQNEAIDKLTAEEVSLSEDVDIAKVRSQIDRELRDAGSSDREINAELTRFDEIMKEWKGEPTAVDPSSIGTQLMRIGKNLNIARLLGQTGFTMGFELGGAMFHTGARNFMEFSSTKQLVSQMKHGTHDDELMQTIQTHMGLGDELLKSIGATVYDHAYTIKDLHSTGWGSHVVDSIEKFSEKASEATLMVGGVKPLTAYLEMTMAKDTVNNLTMGFMRKNGLSKAHKKTLNELGINEEMLNRIQNQFNKYGSTETKEWSRGQKVKSLNFEKWDDDAAKEMLITAVRRTTNVMVQKSYLGDKVGATTQGSLFKNTLLGQAALELKDYMITAYTAQLGRGLGRRDAYQAGLMASQIAIGGSTLLMQNHINFAGNPEKLAESVEPANIARAIVGKMPITSYSTMMADSASMLIGGDPIFTNSRYHSGLQGSVNSLPMYDLIKKGSDIFSIPWDLASGLYNGEDMISNKNIKSAFGVAPMGNTIFARPIKEWLLSK